jgi:hypothetical protein
MKEKTELLTNFKWIKKILFPTVKYVAERNSKSTQFFFLENC